MLGPQDVGQRVVVRRNVAVRDNRPILGDLLGELVEFAETEITVRTKGGLVRVPVNEIVVAKTVPARRRLTATEAVEFAAAAGWPPAERAELGGWQLRATGGWTMRGNSALAVGDPGVGLDEAIDAVEAWYRERGLRPAIVVPLPLHRRVEAALAGRGWLPEPPVLVMTARLADLALPGGDGVRLDAAPSPDFLSMVGRRKGTLPEAALDTLTAVRQVLFASVYDEGGALLAIGRGAVADDEGRYLGVSLLETAEAARRRGIARRVLGALVEWARSTGATEAYLQVEQRNTAAVALYERIGFRVHHTYVARVLTDGRV